MSGPAVEPSSPGLQPARAVFVVGASRSGTTLMRNILQRSDQIAIAPESHFLGHLLRREGARYYFRKAGDLASDDTLRRIVAMLYEGEFQRRSRMREISPFWRWLVKNIAREELEHRLLAIPSAERTERGLMTAFLRTYADSLGRPIIGDKTPAHLAYTDTLLEWFPGGRIVHMLRDPRAVYVSDLRRRRGKLRRPYSWVAHIPLVLRMLLLVQVTLVWRDAARRHFKLVADRDQYMLVRFEDLVRRPAETLPRVFGFVGVPVPEDATDVKVYARGYSAGSHGLDAEAADRWRAHISRWENAWLSFWCRGSMRRLGYGDD